MSNRIEKTIENHNKGFNCCQAVTCTYADLVGADEATLFAAGEGFGLGMGGAECTCGAISGAVIIAGMKNSSKDLSNPTTKGSTYKLSKEMVAKFVDKNGSMICKDLKGMETGTPLRSCAGCIMDAAAILEEVVFPEEK